MINDDLFLTVLLMFLLSFVAVLLLIAVFILNFIKFSKDKKSKVSPYTPVVIIISLFILYSGLPFWLLAAAYDANNEVAENLHKLSAKISMFSSVKSFMTEELGAFYMRNYEGKKAIDAFENSIKIKENKQSSAMLCLLYSANGERENAFKMCSNANAFQSVAVNYILAEDYKKAVEVINNSINTRKSPSCWDYAIRAYIYRKTGKKDLFENDYKKAESLCPDSSQLKDLYKNENYYTDFYKNLKKDYKF